MRRCLTTPLLALSLATAPLAACQCGGDSVASTQPDAGGPGAASGRQDASQAAIPDAGVSIPDAAQPPDAAAAQVPDAAVSIPDAALPPDAAVAIPDAGPAPFQRFVAIGDTGEGNDTQRRVGASMGRVCLALGGCDFGLLLGDNFYNSGVDSVEDARFNTMFVEPYGPLGFPFHPVLGNHDYGGEGAGIEPWKGSRQVDYSAVNPQWVMPSTYYQVEHAPVWLMALNTTAVFWGVGDAQENDVPGWIDAAPVGSWKIAFGHHPYLSNGKHGNAGSYDSVPDFIPYAPGGKVKDFVEAVLCGKVDAYICGHDHDRQDLEATCGTQFLVSGAGAKTTDLSGTNPTHFERNTPGFLMVEATPTKLTFRFYDQDGVQEHERSLTR